MEMLGGSVVGSVEEGYEADCGTASHAQVKKYPETMPTKSSHC
jgi:hypothetical protein